MAGVPTSSIAFLDGGGRMGALMRSHDWSRSPLGDPSGWPDALKVAVSTCLSSRFPMVIWWGPELLMLYNDAWQPILGETKHPAGLGRPGAESWPETWAIVGAQFENALKGIASWSEDLLLPSDRHGFLEECYFTYSHGPLRDASGEVVGVCSVVSETTARVVNERRLRILRDLSNATVEAASEPRSLQELSQALVELLCAGNPDVPLPVQYLTDADGRAHLFASSGVDAALFPAEVTPEGDDAWRIGAVLRKRADVTAPAPATTPALPGGVWPEPAREIVALPLSSSSVGAQLCGVLLVGVNPRLRLDPAYVDFLRLVAAQLGAAVSATHLLENERAARASAERAARAKDEFLATLSHELRTPLSAVIGWARILKTDLANPKRASTAVEIIERNAQQQVRLIDDLLDISRITSGAMGLERQPVDLASVIEAALESVLPAAAAKGVALRKSLAPPARTVSGDAARIEQIVWNLLVNAVKFTPAGGTVEVALSAAGPRAEIRVTDTGEGIAPEFLPHIFERFRQADASASRPHGGLGLGLTLVKEFAELHGGSVRASSSGRGRGATFVIAPPLAAGAELRAEPAAARVEMPPAGLDGARVLVIDDDPDTLAMIRRILEDRLARVTTAATATTALELLAGDRFDVIVSDIGLPGRDGYELMAELGARGVRTPAVALTAFAHADDRGKALAVGYRAYFAQPFDTADFLATLARLAR